jgi:acetyltransferase-like isoleucine patch superfamily enzyme
MRPLRLKHRLLMLYSGLLRFALKPALDEIPFLRRLRGFCYGLVMPVCGSNFQVSSDAILWGLEHMRVGKDVYIGPGVVLICLEALTVGDGVLIGPHVVVSNGNHRYRDGAYQLRENEAAPIAIGAGSWIGANATVLAGVTIGKGVLVAANSTVTRDVSDYDSVGGVPARSLRSMPSMAEGARVRNDSR